MEGDGAFVGTGVVCGAPVLLLDAGVELVVVDDVVVGTVGLAVDVDAGVVVVVGTGLTVVEVVGFGVVVLEASVVWFVVVVLGVVDGLVLDVGVGTGVVVVTLVGGDDGGGGECSASPEHTSHDPYIRFLYDASKGTRPNHNKRSGNILARLSRANNN